MAFTSARQSANNAKSSKQSERARLAVQSARREAQSQRGLSYQDRAKECMDLLGKLQQFPLKQKAMNAVNSMMIALRNVYNASDAKLTATMLGSTKATLRSGLADLEGAYSNANGGYANDSSITKLIAQARTYITKEFIDAKEYTIGDSKPRYNTSGSPNARHSDPIAKYYIQHALSDSGLTSMTTSELREYLEI